MALIYIVEDDPAMRSGLAKLLSLEGYDILACDDFEHAPAEALAAKADCILLDLKLPSADGSVGGHAICREIRKASDVPIIVLTSMTDEFDEVLAMKLGAHDYITKPYRPAVLVARIEALLRRHAKDADPRARSVIEHAGVTLDLRASSVSYDGRSAILTRNEQQILSTLMSCPGTVVSRSDLMCDLWESDAFVDDNTLTVNINRLRGTLSGIGVPQGFVQTRRGQGYVV